MTKSFHSISEDELRNFLAKSDFEEFRLKQIQHWIYSGKILSFDQMKNLPRELREKLATEYHLCEPSVIKEQKDPVDGTIKMLVGFPDGNHVENAIIMAPGRRTFCLSSQSGCAVGCVFCASGINGLRRNLLSHEIVEEFMLCRSRCGTNPSNLVFMGVGEALMNYDNLLSALTIICSPNAFALSPRRITISTSGYVPGILRLAEERRPWNLALSLHSADNSVRRKIVPNMSYSIPEMMNACAKYKKATGRIVTVEYVLLDGINSSEPDAAELAILCEKNGMKINLIPFNPHPSRDFKRPPEAQIKKFENVLRRYKVPFTTRIEKGGDIHAACGQLMAEYKKTE